MSPSGGQAAESPALNWLINASEEPLPGAESVPWSLYLAGLVDLPGRTSSSSVFHGRLVRLLRASCWVPSWTRRLRDAQLSAGWPWVTNHTLLQACPWLLWQHSFLRNLAATATKALKLSIFMSLPPSSAKILFKLMGTILSLPGTIVLMGRKFPSSDVSLSDKRILLRGT